jgi:hypothetical protein
MQLRKSRGLRIINVLPAGITIIPPLPHVDRAWLMAGTSSTELFPADEGVQVSRFGNEDACLSTALKVSNTK